jgi:WD40 repeat protein
VATCGEDKVVRLTDPATLQASLLKKHTDAVTCAAFSRDGKLLATGSRDKTIKIWSLPDGRELRTLLGHTGEIRQVQFSRDAKTLVSAGADKVVKVWDLAGAGTSPRSSFAGDTAALSADDKLLAVCGEVAGKAGPSGTRIVDLAAGKERLVLPVLTHDARSLLFSPDGAMLVTAGGATPGLRIWDVANGRLRASPQEVAGVVALAISTDGKTIATGQSDGLVKLWDTSTWRSRIMLPAHREAITSLAISADNKMLVTSSIDGSAKLWQIAGGKSVLAAR